MTRRLIVEEGLLVGGSSGPGAPHGRPAPP